MRNQSYFIEKDNHIIAKFNTYEEATLYAKKMGGIIKPAIDE